MIGTQLIAMNGNNLEDPSTIISREQFQQYCKDYKNKKNLKNYQSILLDLDSAAQDQFHPFNTHYANEVAKLEIHSLARLLYKSAEQGDIFEASLILKTNKDVVSLTQDFTHSPLQSAIKYNKINMMIYLIKFGKMSVDYNYCQTGTALYIAVCLNNVEAAKILITAGADPNKEHHSRTTLFPAAEKGNLEMVQYLLSLKDTKGKLKVDINAKDKIKCTSLYYAARYGHLNVVKALIKSRADAGIRGIYGTPLEAAMEKKHKEIINYLEKPSFDRVLHGTLLLESKKKK